MKEYEEIIRQKGLPEVGQTVRNKRYGTLWRIIEKREVWQNISDDPITNEPRMIPAIYLCFWRIQPGVVHGVGKMLGYTYTLLDDSFESHWETLPENQVETNSQFPSSSAKILEFSPQTLSCHGSRKRLGSLQNSETAREGRESSGQIINFRLTKKALYRMASREIVKLYQLSRGGQAPIIDDFSREAFEKGEIEEVRWIDWVTYLLQQPERDSF